MPSLFPSHLHLLFLLILALIQTGKTDLMKVVCSQTNKGTSTNNNTAFSENLNSLISSLITGAVSQAGFDQNSTGKFPNDVYGIALCRGDVSSDDCYSCLSSAKMHISRSCQLSPNAAIWYDECMLHYSNTDFLSNIDDNSTSYCLANTPSLYAVTQQFNSFVYDHLENLTSVARDSPLLFATGAVNYSSTFSIYGLVQCTRDLSRNNCYQCLTELLSTAMNCTYDKAEGMVLGLSCYLHFQDSLFYNLDESSVTPAPIAMSPGDSIEFSGSPTQFPGAPQSPKPVALNNTIDNAGTKKHASETRFVIPIIVVCLTLVIALGIWCCVNKVKPANIISPSLFRVNMCFTVRKATRKKDTLDGPRENQLSLNARITGPAGSQEQLAQFDTYTALRAIGEPMMRVNALLVRRNTSQIVRIYSLQKLRDATDNFSSDKHIGKGASGQVFEAILDGEKVAIKKSTNLSDNMVNELRVAASLVHRNIVRLIGGCFEDHQKLLVYEYLAQRSLNFHLFNHLERRQNLDWGKRYKIIRGVAQGLLYLHNDSGMNIIHRDLKPENILLDENFNPKIADFDISRTYEPHKTHQSSDKTKGTLGYIAPELLYRGHYSVASDVFSYGVLVLETVTGRRRTAPDLTEDLLNIVEGHYNQGNEKEVVDSILEGRYQRDEVMRCIMAGLHCVRPNPKSRPTMLEIIRIIEGCDASSSREKESRVGSSANLSTRIRQTAGQMQMNTGVIMSVNGCTITDTELPR